MYKPSSDQVTQIWKEQRENMLAECRQYFVTDPLAWSVQDRSRHVGTSLTPEGRRPIIRAYNFGRPLSRFSLSLFSLGRIAGPMTPPGFELEIRAGKGPTSMLAPLAVVQYFFDTYDDSGFLLQIQGRLYSQWEIYGRAIDNARYPGVTATSVMMEFGIEADVVGSSRDLSALPAPFANVLVNNV